MLSVSTLWATFVVNFFALGLVWAYVVRSYPNLESARFWTASSFVAAAGGVLAMLHVGWNSIFLIHGAGTTIVLAACLAAMGIRRFYDRPASWRLTALTVGVCFFGLSAFIAYDCMPMRIFIYATCQSLPLAMVLKLLLSHQKESRPYGQINPGARLSAIVIMIILGIFAVREMTMLLGMGGSYLRFEAMQPISVLVLLFLSMLLNFGFLLMAIDRLRTEISDLALLDDLTGVGNRRHLLQRLTEECARSERSGASFALMVIDLDNFKSINDTHGHAAGDSCLRHFTLMAQTRLRPGDMLARTGGDEFCIVLPSSTLREGAMIARRVLEVCRADAKACVGSDIPISVSIGVAQWNRETGLHPDRLIAAADHALYAAKKDGRNRYAVYDPASAPATKYETGFEEALRKLA
jgi:diguanylate cyclase (GGDEF)-like protein